MAYSLADLLTPRGLDEIRAAYLASLQGAGFPAVTEWLPKAGVEMAYVDMIARAETEIVAVDEPAIAASGFLGEATGLFMDLWARNMYRLKRIDSTSTTFNLQFSLSAAAPPYNLAVGDIIVTAPSGNRYTNQTPLNIQPGTLSDPVAFIAEAPGASFSDNPTPGATGAVSMVLVTAFAGLSPVTASADFAAVVQSGPSSGQIKPIRSGSSAPAPHTFAIRIDSTGEVGVATYSLSLDGAAYLAQGLLLATQDLDGGTRIVAIPGGVTPSFIAGDTFTVVSPGGPNFVQGSDAESGAALAARGRARWPALSPNPTQLVYSLWARLAYSPASRIQVTPDTLIPGQVDVVVADSHGPISPVSAEIIETFIAARLSVLDSVRVRPATSLGVTTAGSVTVTRGSQDAVQAASQEAWLLYLGTVALGGVVRISELEQAIMDAGASDVDLSSLQINGVAGNLQLAAGVIPVDANTGGLAVALTWMLA
jgi:uncharacterized phage protein gp47/JayE